MNNLIKEAGRILDLDPVTHLSLITNEADSKEKLRNTYMFVNGELKYIRGFIWGDGLVEVYNQEQDNTELVMVKTLEPWLPLSGMYSCPDFTLYLVKKAHKHWRKSFYHDNYRMDFLTYLTSTQEKKLYTTMSTLQPTQIAIVKDCVYLEGKPVGKVGKKGEILCTKPQFYQELLDFSRKKDLNWTISL